MAQYQANISTGVVETTITNALYQDFPLAVYSVDKVLLPPDLFGPKSAKSHASTANKGKNETSALSPSSDSEDDTDADTKSTSGVGFKGAKWGSIAGLLFMSILNLLWVCPFFGFDFGSANVVLGSLRLSCKLIVLFFLKKIIELIVVFHSYYFHLSVV